MKVGIYSLLLIILSGAGIPVLAQTISQQPAPVEYAVSPQNPEPGQSVQLTITGTGSFLGDAKIVWSQNNTIISSGIGDSTVTITTGALGTQSVVHVTITSTSEGTLDHTFVISPSLTNLVWEANTTTPLFYKGAALYSPGADITVVAFPEVVINKEFISSQALSFQWKLHGVLVPEQSGLGKNIFTFAGDQLTTAEDVSLAIYYGNTQVGNGEISIPASQPEIVFYDRDPLRGELLDSALLNSANFGNKELTIQAEPFYFSKENPLTYQWTVNGQNVSGPDSNKGILTLRTDTTSSGTATVALAIQNLNTDQLLQSAETALQLVIGSQPTTPTL